MKLTVNSAMRARDVSRPRDEHLAEASSAELLAETDAVAAGDGMAIGPEPAGAIVESATAETADGQAAAAGQAAAGAGTEEAGEAAADGAPRPRQPKRHRPYRMRRGR
ncbi:MAG TPA: hypothetical protein VF070_39240 [Streptosporangiaceae bacterium]